MTFHDLHKSRTGADWRYLIDRLRCDNRTRVCVANIVAWDFFFRHSSAKRWADLDDYIAVYRSWMHNRFGDPDKIYKMLRKLGYEVVDAEKRRAGVKRSIRDERKYSQSVRL